MLALFSSSEVKADPVLARRLDELHGIRESLARQKASAKGGRGALALDALVMLEEGRLAALRFKRATPAEFQEALSSLDRLRSLQARWNSGDGAGLSPLYAATKTDGQGRRLWTVEGWHTSSDIARLEEGGRIERGTEGRLWLKPEGPAGEKLELVAGTDAAEARRAEAEKLSGDNAARTGIYEVLEKSEFALKSLTGTEVKGIGYEELLRGIENGEERPSNGAISREIVCPDIRFLKRRTRGLRARILNRLTTAGSRPSSHWLLPHRPRPPDPNPARTSPGSRPKAIRRPLGSGGWRSAPGESRA